MSNPKIGRPKSDNPKDLSIKIRIDKKTNDRLVEYANKYSISRTEVIRKGIDLVLAEEK